MSGKNMLLWFVKTNHLNDEPTSCVWFQKIVNVDTLLNSLPTHFWLFPRLWKCKRTLMIWTSLLTPRPLSTSMTWKFYKRDVFIIHSARRLGRKKHTEYQQKQIRPQDPVLPIWKRTSSSLHTNASFQTNVVPAKNGQAMTICAWKCCILQTTSLWCLIDLFGMLRWKSSAEISEHSTKQQKPENDRRPDIRSVACDIWSPDLRGERAHGCTHVCTRVHSHSQRRVRQWLISLRDRGLTSVARR